MNENKLNENEERFFPLLYLPLHLQKFVENHIIRWNRFSNRTVSAVPAARSSFPAFVLLVPRRCWEHGPIFARCFPWKLLNHFRTGFWGGCLTGLWMQRFCRRTWPYRGSKEAARAPWTSSVAFHDSTFITVDLSTGLRAGEKDTVPYFRVLDDK